MDRPEPAKAGNLNVDIKMPGMSGLIECFCDRYIAVFCACTLRLRNKSKSKSKSVCLSVSLLSFLQVGFFLSISFFAKSRQT